MSAYQLLPSGRLIYRGPPQITIGYVHDGELAASSTPQAIAFMARPGNRERVDEYLARRTAVPPVVEWPLVLPADEGVPEIIIASASRATLIPDSWYVWRDGRDGTVIRHASPCTPPSVWRVRTGDEPVTVEEIRAVRDDAERVGYRTEESALRDHVRRRRGDPWFNPWIHESPLWLTEAEAAEAGTMTLSSEHAIVVVRPTLADPADPRCRWSASTGIGSHMEVCPGPGSYPTEAEATQVAIAWWRHGVRERIMEIWHARGRTLAWGLEVQLLEAPVIVRPARDENAWDLYHANAGAGKMVVPSPR